MGNREDLLASARRCLIEKGFGRTTARDIATGAGVSLAAIGYHYGSKDALLVRAMIEAIAEWGDSLGAVLAETAGVTDPDERFVRAWDAVLASFTEHRGLWAVQFEMVSQIEHLPELKKQLTAVQKDGRLGLAMLFQGRTEPLDTPEELERGTVYQSLLTGLAAQWMIAPELAPSGADFLRGLRTVAADLASRG
ncbi:TetR/AcrR family transcriptional regulator [Kitasatospora sp. NPDC048365]|uniref:TetR/AcrR family transcriptional regulator n=1 Tax=Kitasatospora sp. NPDC048365 TaxID=3364050 RepID=UPI00371201DB